jgi:hypothetical protein
MESFQNSCEGTAGAVDVLQSGPNLRLQSQRKIITEMMPNPETMWWWLEVLSGELGLGQ